MKYKDYYQILGLERNAGQDEIKKAYRKLSRKYHPDVSKEKNAEEMFKEINEAYQVLKDSEKRAAYDRLGRHQPGEEFRPGPGWEREFAQGNRDFGSFSDADLGDLFEQLFGARRGRADGRRGFAMRGQDFEATVQVTLEDAYRGTVMEIPLVVTELVDGKPRRTHRPVKVRIPPGVVDGQKMRVPGKGGPGSEGGPDGDLYLNILFEGHRLFKTSGHDLYLELPVTPWEAALGASIEVPTLSGRVRLKVPPGARAGQRLRIASRGLPKPDGSFGDFYAVLQITSPATLTEQEQALFEQLAKTSRFNPRSHLI